MKEKFNVFKNIKIFLRVYTKTFPAIGGAIFPQKQSSFRCPSTNFKIARMGNFFYGFQKKLIKIYIFRLMEILQKAVPFDMSRSLYNDICTL